MQNTKQHTLWLLAAMSAPLAHCSGSGWLMSALAVLVILPLNLIRKDWKEMTGTMALLQSVWLGIAAGTLLQSSAYYWPSDNRIAVPLTLLALAVLTGTAAAPRIGAVLAVCIGLLALPAAASGAARIEPGWLKPAVTSWPWALTGVLLLANLPAAGGRGSAVPIGILTLVLSALTQGMISIGVAASVPDPFYQTARALGYLEPVIAAAVTLGWYAMTTSMIQSAVLIVGKEKRAVVLTAGTAAAIMIAGVQLPQQTLAVFSGFFWVLIPFWNKIKKP